MIDRRIEIAKHKEKYVGHACNMQIDEPTIPACVSNRSATAEAGGGTNC